MPTYITSNDAVALTMAAKHGSRAPQTLRTFFEQSDNPYVKNVGIILINEKAAVRDAYFEAAQKLAREVATREPITITLAENTPTQRGHARHAFAERGNGGRRTALAARS